MKAISLLQPWATLIMLGYKLNETRSWQTSHRGPLAIAASKGKPAYARQVCEADPYIKRALEKHHLTFDTLPRGVVLGMVEVEGIKPIDKDLISRLSPLEFACGDYSMPGRFAWQLGWPREASYPVPCKGALSVWELPPDVEFCLRCPRCAEHLNPNAVSPCFCGGEGQPEPDGEPSYTSDGHPY